jgi:hypothetical protein
MRVTIGKLTMILFIGRSIHYQNHYTQNFLDFAYIHETFMLNNVLMWTG